MALLCFDEFRWFKVQWSHALYVQPENGREHGILKHSSACLHRLASEPGCISVIYNIFSDEFLKPNLVSLFYSFLFVYNKKQLEAPKHVFLHSACHSLDHAGNVLEPWSCWKRRPPSVCLMLPSRTDVLWLAAWMKTGCLFVDVVTERLKIRRAAKQEAKRRAEEAKQEAESTSINPAEERVEPSSEPEKAEGSESMEDGSSQGNPGFVLSVSHLKLLVFLHTRGPQFAAEMSGQSVLDVLLFIANGHSDSPGTVGPFCCSPAASVQPAAGDCPASAHQDPPGPKAESFDSKHNEAQAAGTPEPAPEPSAPPLHVPQPSSGCLCCLQHAGPCHALRLQKHLFVSRALGQIPAQAAAKSLVLHFLCLHVCFWHEIFEELL